MFFSQKESHNLLLHRTFQYSIIILICVAFLGYWYWQKTRAAQTVGDDRPSFEAPLTTSLDLIRGMGVATFSRADGADRRATVTDFENLIRPVKSGEARFEGARRVENFISYSETFDNAAWGKQGSVSVTANQATAPDGSLAADLISIGSYASGDAIGRSFGSGNLTGKYVFSVWLRADSDLTAGISIGRASQNPSNSQSVSLTTTWKRFSVSFTNDGVEQTIYGNLYGQNQTFYAWGAQLEEVTGQDNQNPSEYVSCGVKTAVPYHGANVDCVKYFDTENGNTVASGVITEATGTKISNTTLKGYLAEGSRENIVLRSEEIDNASWSKTDVTVTANDTTAPDGRMTAEKLTTSTASNPNAYTANATASAARYTGSVWIKAGNTIEAAIQLYQNGQGGVNQSAVILSGPGTISGNGTQIITISDLSTTEWTRVATTSDANVVGSANINFYVKNRLSGSTIGDYNYFWGAQLEQASFASSYIPTAGSALTRISDSLEYPLSGNAEDTTGTVVLEVTPNWSGGSGWDAFFFDHSLDAQRMALWHWNGTNNHLGVDRDGGGGTRNIYDDSTVSITRGSLMKLGQRFSSSANSLFCNGELKGSDTTLTLPYDTITSGNLFIGRHYWGAGEAYATIKNVRIWKKALTDSALQNITSTTDAVSGSATGKAVSRTTDNTGLIGHWSFEEGSGTKTEDVSFSNANTGTLTNGPSFIDGKIGKALSFDGTDDFVTMGNVLDMGTSNFSISAWVKSTSTATGNYNGIVYKKSTVYQYSAGYRLNMPDGKFNFEIADGTDYVSLTSSTSGKNDGLWHHVVATAEKGQAMKIYVDGVLDGTAAETTIGNIDSSMYFSIGALTTDGSNYYHPFDGSIDDVRIYNKALSQAEVANLYRQGGVGKTTINVSQNDKLTSGLIGFWSFNGKDVSGTTAYDRSGQGNNGTLIGGTAVYPGKVGQALSFDAIDDQVSISDNASLDISGDVTISVWLKPTASLVGYAAHPIAKLTSTSDANYVLYYFGTTSGTDKQLTFYANRGGTWNTISGSHVATLGEWVHIAVSYTTASGGQLYVNGVATGSLTGSGALATNSADLFFGDSSSTVFPGLMDEVRIYNRALSASEIQSLYIMGK
ncbi:MAG: hypothetical protein HYV45_01755 [Candidatus Moranbacteria bacterium]|nr:hypothetical protein [Candidatus Moranbacteria bacterium]